MSQSTTETKLAKPIAAPASRSELTGRGAGVNPPNRFDPRQEAAMHYEAIDELPEALGETQYYEENPKRVVNPVDSPDVGMQFSLNPYQGCEHGCVYCYARPTHEYWGWSAGVDFERRIIVKRNAPDLLRALFQSRTWQPAVIALSGNTDCYQPVERKLGITRRLLEVFLAHRNPVGILTKNALVLRDLGLLREMAAMNLVRVGMSVTSLDEELRRRLEPRTVTAKTRLMTLEKLAEAGVPTFAMAAPIIPGLNSHEIPALVEALANAGVARVGHTILRLNGPNGEIFRTWLETHYPDRAQKIWHAIEQCHGGQVNDSRIGTRMGGEGPVAEQIHQLFTIAKRKHLAGRELPAYDFSHFRRRPDVPTLF